MKKHRKPRQSRRTGKEEYDQDDMEGPVIDESMLSVKELLGLQQAEERLKRDCIYRLKKENSALLTVPSTRDLVK